MSSSSERKLGPEKSAINRGLRPTTGTQCLAFLLCLPSMLRSAKGEYWSCALASTKLKNNLKLISLDLFTTAHIFSSTPIPLYLGDRCPCPGRTKLLDGSSHACRTERFAGWSSCHSQLTSWAALQGEIVLWYSSAITPYISSSGVSNPGRARTKPYFTCQSLLVGEQALLVPEV